MSLLVPDTGELKILAPVKTYLQSLDMKIFVNNHTPAQGDAADASDYTNAITIASQHPAWGSITTVSNKASMSLSAAMTFAQTSAVSQTAYGWFMTDPNDGNKLVMAELFASPIALLLNGDAVKITTLDFRLFS